jgi:hypothetical protein
MISFSSFFFSLRCDDGPAVDFGTTLIESGYLMSLASSSEHRVASSPAAEGNRMRKRVRSGVHDDIMIMLARIDC